MRLTFKQAAELSDFLKGLASEKKIHAWPLEIAVEASRALGYEVKGPQVTRVAKIAGIQIYTKGEGGNQPAPEEAREGEPRVRAQCPDGPH